MGKKDYGELKAGPLFEAAACSMSYDLRPVPPHWSVGSARTRPARLA